jgi:hypothetical protein
MVIGKSNGSSGSNGSNNNSGGSSRVLGGPGPAQAQRVDESSILVGFWGISHAFWGVLAARDQDPPNRGGNIPQKPAWVTTASHGALHVCRFLGDVQRVLEGPGRGQIGKVRLTTTGPIRNAPARPAYLLKERSFNELGVAHPSSTCLGTSQIEWPCACDF